MYIAVEIKDEININCLRFKPRSCNYTCGRGTTPVKSVYCLNASFGVGPIRINTSIIPLSDIKLAAGGEVVV